MQSSPPPGERRTGRLSGLRAHRLNIAFLACTHVGAVIGLVMLFRGQVAAESVWLAVAWFVVCGLAITGGYHRLFAHATYRANALVRALFLFFGAGAVQNSALAWSADHRDHHAHTDRDADPYSVRHGFWWAHMGWVLFERDRDHERVPVGDLQADPLVRWQHRWYLPIAIVAAGGVPMLLGLLWGDPIGALFVAGFLRLVFQWQSTFAINSIAHTIGSRPYSRHSTARDSFLLALITLGEGYHNFHHRFPADYRNGVRWFHFDPTKWVIWSLSLLGVASGLKRIPKRTIEMARVSSAGTPEAPEAPGAAKTTGRGPAAEAVHDRRA